MNRVKKIQPLGQTAGEDVAALVMKGVQQHQAGQLREAEQIYRRVLEISPDNPHVSHLLGGLEFQTGRPDQAIELITKAIDRLPDQPQFHANLGAVYQSQKRFEEALDCYHKALAIDPAFVEAQYGLGNTLRSLDRLQEAEASYREALAQAPDNYEIHNNLGTILQKRGRLEEALESYCRAIDLKPNYTAIWHNLNSLTKAVQYDGGKLIQNQDRYLAKLSDAARASSEFVMLDYSLSAYKPHLADESFAAAMASLPPRDQETIVIDGVIDAAERPELPGKIIALLHFGRSGTGLLHSLIDGHAEISTLPGIYLRGYFNPGVWKVLSAGGWRQLPDRFADMFEVLFDASSSKTTPGTLTEKISQLGVSEGMTRVGENRDECLSLDRRLFRDQALALLSRMGSVDPLSFLQVAHAAYEQTLCAAGGAATPKQTIFYHIHNPEHFAKLNFLRYAPDARLVMMVREPIQCCESWLRVPFADNDYDQVIGNINRMLFAIDEVTFRVRESVGVRLEDLKRRPEATLRALCAWMGVAECPSLYEMTAQGKKWWGDPSSPDYGNGEAQSPFDDHAVTRAVGSIFSDDDQFILGTLFYPFSVRFGYREADQAAFERDLREIRPLLNRMFDFEKAMAERAGIDHDSFMADGYYRLFRAGLLERWAVLDELGTYPHMLTPLDVTAR